jgi:heme-degrading monooxygenase HmoA
MMTFVNVFTVLPNKQKDSLQSIQKLYGEVIRHQPGFISARLLTSDDGTRITAIALWESEEQLAAVKQTLSFQDFHELRFLYQFSMKMH